MRINGMPLFARFAVLISSPYGIAVSSAREAISILWLVVHMLFIGFRIVKAVPMTPNIAVFHASNAADIAVSAALLAAEKTGQIAPDRWPMIRDLLLASTDPQLIAAVDLMRQFMQARQAAAVARLELDHGYAAVAAALNHPAQIAAAAASLSMLADELSARAQQLAALEE